MTSCDRAFSGPSPMVGSSALQASSFCWTSWPSSTLLSSSARYLRERIGERCNSPLEKLTFPASHPPKIHRANLLRNANLKKRSQKRISEGSFPANVPYQSSDASYDTCRKRMQVFLQPPDRDTDRGFFFHQLKIPLPFLACCHGNVTQRTSLGQVSETLYKGTSSPDSRIFAQGCAKRGDLFSHSFHGRGSVQSFRRIVTNLKCFWKV